MKERCLLMEGRSPGVLHWRSCLLCMCERKTDTGKGMFAHSFTSYILMFITGRTSYPVWLMSRALKRKHCQYKKLYYKMFSRQFLVAEMSSYEDEMYKMKNLPYATEAHHTTYEKRVNTKFFYECYGGQLTNASLGLQECLDTKNTKYGIWRVLSKPVFSLIRR